MNRANTQELERVLRERLPLLGHRNWIVVTDAAYPLQSSPGIETLLCSESQIEATRKVMEAIESAAHIRANIYTDAELQHVAENDAEGIDFFRRQLAQLLQGQSALQIPHEEIIAKLDQAAKLFRVLLVKTNAVLPYTSVFFELDCGYWNADAEQRLRKAMQAASTR